MRRFLSILLVLGSVLTGTAAFAAPSTTVVISEFRTRGPNGANDEFVEIFNVSASPVDISGFRLQRSSAAGVATQMVVIPPGTIVPARHFYLVVNNGVQGYSGSVGGDLTYTGGIADAGGIALVDANVVPAIVDQVGMSALSLYKEGATLAPETQNVNQSYERKNAGCAPDQDTDDNFNDFNSNGDTSHPQSSMTICNPCLGVQCISPPNTQCYDTTGVCQAGSCVYAQHGNGSSCNDQDVCSVGDKCKRNASGTCVSGAGNACNTPPPSVCTSATTLRTYQSTGVCVDPTGCAYTFIDSPCTFGCALGACSPNPCMGMACNTPPNGQCYLPVGTCSGGICSYTVTSGAVCTDGNACTVGDVCNAAGTCVPGALSLVDDGNACTADSCNTTTGVVSHTPVANGASCEDGIKCNGAETCQAGVCTPGMPVVCVTPPAGGCYDMVGACQVNGSCSYPTKPATTPCDDTDPCTVSDACNGNGVCSGSTKICTPPPPACEAGGSRTFFNGACNPADGTCTFSSTLTACSAGCDGTTGLCNNDPCTGVVCNSPPSQCHQDVGTCAAGTCSYALKPGGAKCDDGNACTTADACSAAGLCVGSTLQCNTPPPPVCADATTSRVFDTTGTCAAGACTYAGHTDTKCMNGCDGMTGLCLGDPCAGVTCDQPPDTCHQDVGTCAAGLCDYALKQKGSACDDGDPCTVSETCDAVGFCSGGPKTCNTPPAPTCTGASSTSYSADGTCDATGACQYIPTSSACTTGCNASTGLCNEDPCAMVTCNTPPGPCFLNVGTCKNAVCTYGSKGTGTACDDGNVCTQDDTCDPTGVCAGTVIPSCGAGGAGGVGGAGGSTSVGGAGGKAGSTSTGGNGGSSAGQGGAGTGGTGTGGTGTGGTGTGGTGASGAAGKGGSTTGAGGSSAGGAGGSGTGAGGAGHAGNGNGGASAGKGGSAGGGGKSGGTSAGGGATLGAGGAGTSNPINSTYEPETEGGCGCEVPAQRPGSGAMLLSLLGLAGLVARRRRAA